MSENESKQKKRRGETCPLRFLIPEIDMSLRGGVLTPKQSPLIIKEYFYAHTQCK